MGAWDTSSFGNDDAADWAWQLEEVEGLTLVEETLARVLEEANSEGYVEAPTGSEAIAACEVLAGLKGNICNRDAYSETALDWVAAHPMKPGDSVLAKASKVLDVITSEKSELRALWEDSEYFAEWQSNIANLRKRMSS